LTAGGVARSLQIHADMRLASALPAAKIPASSCKGYFSTDPYPRFEFLFTKNEPFAPGALLTNGN
jgi:hypothetical protein